jgi:hypothetical protein
LAGFVRVAGVLARDEPLARLGQANDWVRPPVR